jgi:hypothetical protein
MVAESFVETLGHNGMWRYVPKIDVARLWAIPPFRRTGPRAFAMFETRLVGQAEPVDVIVLVGSQGEITLIAEDDHQEAVAPSVLAHLETYLAQCHV